MHHVWARGNGRQVIYLDDGDRETYLTMLSHVAERHAWHCLSYCLMPNHVHLLIETPQANLGAGMQRLHGAYAQGFNKQHERSGHLFQGRFGSSRMASDRQLWTVVRYIALNPVEAGLCKQPEQWEWSSHNATLTGKPQPCADVDRLLWFLHATGADPLKAYTDLVATDAGSDPATS